MDNTAATPSQAQMKELETMLGGTFEHYISSPTDITPYVWEFLSFRVSGRRLFLYDLAETFMINGEERELPVLEISDEERLEKAGQQIFTINNVIRKIHVVNDRITVTFPDGERSSLETTHALVFDFGNDKQLMFEQQSCNSETIRIFKGFGAMEDLADPARLKACFPEGIDAVTERRVITLS